MSNSYITPEQYFDLGYNNIPADDIELFLTRASRAVDSLTFNRIGDYNSLTSFQKGIIEIVICEHADFLYENQEIITGPVNKWSFEGVSMEFGEGINIIKDCGVIIESSLYSLLKQTGLCCRVL